MEDPVLRGQSVLLAGADYTAHDQPKQITLVSINLVSIWTSSSHS